MAENKDIIDEDAPTDSNQLTLDSSETYSWIRTKSWP